MLVAIKRLTIFLVLGSILQIFVLPTPNKPTHATPTSDWRATRVPDLGERSASQYDSPGLIEVPVIQLNFFPPDPENPEILDRTETGWGSPEPFVSRFAHPAHFIPLTIEEWEARTAEMVAGMRADISNATYYHGYQEERPPAGKYLEYNVIEKWDYYEALPPGYLMFTRESADLTATIDGEERLYPGGGTENHYRPNYRQILLDLPNDGICHYVDQLGVREVWIYGYHADTVVPEGMERDFIIPDESRMASKYGDISNSWPDEAYIPSEYKLPLCDHAYVLYNFTYQPQAWYGNTIHNRMHQIENVVFFAEDRGYPIILDPPNYKGTVFWDDFSVYHRDFQLEGYRSSCGNTHFPPNALKPELEYGYSVSDSVPNNCATWHTDDNQTTYVTQDCSTWGCYDGGFYFWYMQNMPGWQNEIVDENGCQMRNWWELMADFDLFIDKGRTLWSCPDNPIETLEESLGIEIPTPAPTVTPSLTPSLTPTTEIPTEIPTETPSIVETATPQPPTAEPTMTQSSPQPSATPVGVNRDEFLFLPFLLNQR